MNHLEDETISHAGADLQGTLAHPAIPELFTVYTCIFLEKKQKNLPGERSPSASNQCPLARMQRNCAPLVDDRGHVMRGPRGPLGHAATAMFPWIMSYRRPQHVTAVRRVIVRRRDAIILFLV